MDNVSLDIILCIIAVSEVENCIFSTLEEAAGSHLKQEDFIKRNTDVSGRIIIHSCI